MTTTRPTDVAAVLHGLVRDPGRPRVTWYGPDHERVELSGAVLVNWVVKTTNLLVEELDVQPGTRVLLDLPAHWRALTWATAAWRAGACVVRAERSGAPQDGHAVDVVVTDRPDAHSGTVVAVTLAALARSWPGTLPRGAVDAAAAVMTYPDALGWLPPADPQAPAVAGGADVVPHAGLTAAALADAPSAGARVLRDARGDDAVGLALAALGTWAVGGSLVLVDGAALDDAALARVRETERVTAAD
ncbi:TIGR03089 family protein [Cellulomonas sp. JZ18]|uniref:TIGR03089 family protein n=1 Tax=Cellulomonas sp. JZ18 TaxID=2654191 RepID=UPI0012D41957|nr:TIGR03089 family protein [Cellulomonas sp. JZ18]QGQ18896.1 TIGR03089 family protein [Cellulomonas sp. JZ18]